MSNVIPRAEYPRPQLVRDSYIPLNGTWMFEIDHAKTGRERGLIAANMLSGKITVPFCPESSLSGVGYKDFMASVWYKRIVNLQRTDKRMLLHIDACDYACEVYINEHSCGIHYGGSAPITHDITLYLVDGDNTITVCAEDDTRSGNQPCGKQSVRAFSYSASYTRTTGIWQSVWMEEVPNAYIEKIKMTPNAVTGEVYFEVTCNNAHALPVACRSSFAGTPTGSASAVVQGNVARFTLSLTEKHLWRVGDGKLYDVELILGDDTVKTYFGLRDVAFDGSILLINGEPIYQRLVLDQGFYPDGIWTAPSDDELIADIHRSLAMGFNGARLHQKVFEPRFLYHCDRLGYIVWGEHGNWGLDISRDTCWPGFIPEWLELLARDYNHPAIIGWCPLNETQANQDNRFVNALYDMTKAFDPLRPFIDCSGWYHVKTDIYDEHDYDQDPDSFRENYTPLMEGKSPVKRNHVGLIASEKITFMSEYGGIKWSMSDGAWGYGNAPKTEGEFISRLKGLTDALLDNHKISAFCYTQLTDVEQEQNGLYTYDRQPKFPPEVIHAILTRKSVIEK